MSREMVWLVAIALSGSALSRAAADERIDALVRLEMQAKPIPGLALAILDQGNVVKTGTYGLANLELNVPVTEDSVFELASLTKQFTAMAILMLAAEQKLSLDDSLIQFVPDGPEGWNSIRIRHLLSHTAGLADRFEETVGGRSIMDHSRADMIRSAMATPPIGSAGEQWQYSDQGYFLLGWIIEEVAGQSYGSFMHERVFDVLQMDDTVVHDKYMILPGRVAGYELNDDRLRNIRRDWQFAIGSHFGVMSSINDMIKWEQALAEHVLLSEADTKLLWNPAWSLSEGEEFSMNYGFGWFVAQLEDRTLVEHTGITGTSYFRDLSTGLAVIILTNQGSVDISLLGRRIAKLLDPEIPFPSAAL